MADDLYDLLGVPRDASADEIKRAYRRRARESHPDAGGDEDTFKRVTHAHEVLRDPQRRARYDRFGDDGTSRGRGGAGGADPFGFGGLGDVLDAFFGGGSGPRGGGGDDSGRDVLVTTTITFEQVASGTTIEVGIDVAQPCDVCGGAGTTASGGPTTCVTCDGRGAVQRVVRTAFGQMATAAPCPTCDGSGRVVADPCAGCGGEGRRPQRRTIDVDVPAGVDDGTRLRLRGRGEAGRRGAPPGDLFVELRLEPHEVFERDGADLWTQVEVSSVRAALGGQLVVTALDGQEHDVELPPGTQPGSVLRIRRAGLPARARGRVGDLHLRVVVVVPTDVTGEERDLLERLAELRGEEVAHRGLGARLREAFRG